MMPVSSHSLAFSPLPQLPPFLSSSPGVELPIFSPFPFLRFHRIFKCEIWINLFCVAERTTSCELQILANTAIYLKWQIRQSNLLEVRRFFELPSFEKMCIFSSHGEHLLENLIEITFLQFWETRSALISINALLFSINDRVVCCSSITYILYVKKTKPHCSQITSVQICIILNVTVA